MIDPTRWKEIGRRRLTSEQCREYMTGNTPSSAETSFNVATVTTFKQNPFRGMQIIYKRIPFNEQTSEGTPPPNRKRP